MSKRSGSSKRVGVAIGGRDHGGDRRLGREIDSAEADRFGRPPALGADRRDPAHALVDRRVEQAVEVVADLGQLLGMGEQRPQHRAGAVARFLHAAEQDHLERGHDRFARAALPRLEPGVQHVRDRRVVGLGFEPVEHRRQALVDLGAGGIRAPLLVGVALEVGGAVGEIAKPATQSRRVELGEAEHGAQAEHRDRLEVLAHQLGTAGGGDRIEMKIDDRGDELVDVLVDGGWAELRIDGLSQLAMRLAVAGEDRRTAEAAIDRRAGHVGGEQLRLRGHPQGLLPAGREPHLDRRNPGYARLAGEGARRSDTDRLRARRP